VLRSLIIALSTTAIAAAAPSVAQQQKAPAVPKPVTRSAFIAKLDSGFQEVDTNHDGFISAAEMEVQQSKELQAFQAAQRAKVQAEFKALDTNKDGQLSLQEFSAGVAPVRANETAEQVLSKMDANKDGKVSPDEFKAPRVAVFDKIDANHDGTVTPAEVKAATTRK